MNEFFGQIKDVFSNRIVLLIIITVALCLFNFVLYVQKKEKTKLYSLLTLVILPIITNLVIPVVIAFETYTPEKARQNIQSFSSNSSNNEITDQKYAVNSAGSVCTDNDTITIESNNSQEKAQTLADADALAKEGKYNEAIALIVAAQEVYGNDKDFDVRYYSFQKNLALSKAEEYYSLEDYSNAICVIDEARRDNPNDIELITAYNIYCDAYEKQVLNIANLKDNENDFDGTISVLKEAQKVIPENKAICAKLEEVENKKPVPISKLVLIDSEEWSINEGEPVDIFGNSHKSEYTCVLYNSNAMFGTTGTSNYAEYRSYGEYSTLTGTISPYQFIEGAIFRIFLDDDLVESYEIGKKTDPIHFEIDISNADYIRFDIGLSYRSGVILSDVLLWK